MSDPYRFTSSLDISGVRIPPGWVPYPDELTWAERLRQWWRRWRGISGRSLPGMDVNAPMPDVKPPRPCKPKKPTEKPQVSTTPTPPPGPPRD